MRDRAAAAAGKPPRRVQVSVDAVLLSPRAGELALLLARADARAREKWMLPWDLLRGDEDPDAAVRRIARRDAGIEPAWLEQAGTLGDSRRHAGASELSIGYVGLLPAGVSEPVGGEIAWFAATELPPLAPRQAEVVDAALAHVRARVDAAPIAFRLLPPTFTLSELQQTYELLLGRRLHKASFRRALQAAYLVDPIDEWRSEGRGRPAQLFRYAPRKRRGGRRAVRFDLLPG